MATLCIHHTHDELKDYYAKQIKNELYKVAARYDDLYVEDDMGRKRGVRLDYFIEQIADAIETALLKEDNFKGLDRYHEGTGRCFDCVASKEQEKLPVKGDFGDCGTCVRNFDCDEENKR